MTIARSGRLEVGRLPAGGQRQEHRAIGAIAGGRPGFLPSARKYFAALVAHLPAEVPAAFEDYKFQHRIAKHRGQGDYSNQNRARESLPHSGEKPASVIGISVKRQNPRRPFGIGGGIWERWCEAGGAQVSRQGPA
jgi:hypothetical protein